jgi:hypothetical protein
MFEDLDALPIDQSFANVSDWEPYNFTDTSFDIPPTDFDSYSWDVPTYATPDQIAYDPNTSLSNPDFGPSAPDFGWSNPTPLAQDDAVSGASQAVGDSQSVSSGFNAAGISNAFGSIWKTISTPSGTSSAAQRTGSSSATTAPKSAIDAIAGLVKNITTTAQIVKDEKTQLTQGVQTIKNAIGPRTQAMSAGPTRTSSPAPGFGGLNINPMVLAVAALGAFLVLRKA